MVEELVNAERVNLTRLETRKTQFETQRETWQSMSRQLSQLQDVARSLYSFENPFNDRLATSSNESLLTASAARSASEGTTGIEILQTAQADRLSSKDLPRELRIDQGVYTFQIGQTRLPVRFRGGTVRDFSEAINRVNPQTLTSNVINNKPGVQVLVLESKLEGAENLMVFDDPELAVLAENLGIISAQQAVSTGPRGTEETRSYQVPPQKVNEFPVAPPQDVDTRGLILRFSASMVEMPIATEQSPPPPGFSVPQVPGVSFGGVSLPSLSSSAPEPPYSPPEPPPRVETGSVVSARVGNRLVPLPEIGFENKEFLISLDELGGLPSHLVVENENTHRIVEVSGIELFDSSAPSTLGPANALSRAQDARLRVQGIEVIRGSNTIDDVIPGVTLNLRRASDTPVDVTVSPDREAAKEKVIEFVAMYNQVIRDINILTRNQPDIIEEITYFSDAEREAAFERLGSFQGNSTLNTIKQRLQNIIITPVETQAGRDMALLSQAGVSTNASGGGASVNIGRLRGYLEINERELDQALEQNFLAVRDLFGKDSDSDLLIDSGVAYSTENLVRPFTQTGGILAINTQTLDSQITRTNTEITNYQDYLEDYEQRMRLQFGQMESAINSLESQSRELEGLNPSNGGNN